MKDELTISAINSAYQTAVEAIFTNAWKDYTGKSGTLAEVLERYSNGMHTLRVLYAAATQMVDSTEKKVS